MKKITTVVLGLILVTAVFAQPGQGRGPQGDCQPGSRMEERGLRDENRDEMMAFMLSDRLDLTTEQADQFFPRFREHQETMEAILSLEGQTIRCMHHELQQQYCGESYCRIHPGKIQNCTFSPIKREFRVILLHAEY